MVNAALSKHAKNETLCPLREVRKAVKSVANTVREQHFYGAKS
jgi:hypothetical protein